MLAQHLLVGAARGHPVDALDRDPATVQRRAHRVALPADVPVVVQDDDRRVAGGLGQPCAVDVAQPGQRDHASPRCCALGGSNPSSHGTDTRRMYAPSMATAAQRQASDIQARMPGSEVCTIFDVGANVGHTVRSYREAYPGASIWAFELVHASYLELREVATELGGVRPFRLALGGSDGQGRVSSQGTSDQTEIGE